MELLARPRVEEDGSRPPAREDPARVANRGNLPASVALASEREAKAMKTIARLEARLINPPVDGPAATLLLRLMAGACWCGEGS